MKRHNVEELKNLLAGTTPGEWTEERVATVFRSTSFIRGKNCMMAQVKNDDGIAPSEHSRANGVLMSMARNFAEELLDLKTYRYGQEDCSGCDDRDAEIERLKGEHDDKLERVKSVMARDHAAEIKKLNERVEWLESQNDFDAKRLRRLATLCGASTPESDESLLNCAGTVLGSICREVEFLLKRREQENVQKGRLEAANAIITRMKTMLRPDQVAEALSGSIADLSGADKARELECQQCQQINFHEDLHEREEKTAIRCAEIALAEPRVFFTDAADPQHRIAAKIHEEFGIEVVA